MILRDSRGEIMGLYSHYDGAHNHPVNRAPHLIAIPVGFSLHLRGSDI
jgi:hypothetical protein